MDGELPVDNQDFQHINISLSQMKIVLIFLHCDKKMGLEVLFFVAAPCQNDVSDA
jgi:hypothetical protein